MGLDIEGNDFTRNDIRFVRNKGYDRGGRHEGFGNNYGGQPKGPQSRSNNDQGGQTTTDAACLINQEVDRRELKEKPLIRKLETRVDTDKEQVKENPLDVTECTDIEEMEPKTSVKVWVAN